MTGRNPVELQLAGSGAASAMVADFRIVSPGYFRTLGIPLLTGELCRESDDQTGYGMVNSFDPAAEGALNDLLGHSITYRVAIGPRAGQKVFTLQTLPQQLDEALDVVGWHKMGPLFTPPVVSNINGPLGTLMVPSQDGGTNWQGGSFDPETGILYVASGSTVVSKAVVPPYPGQSEMAYIEGNAVTGPRTTDGSGSAAGGGRSQFQPAERRVLTPDDPSRGPPKLALSRGCRS